MVEANLLMLLIEQTKQQSHGSPLHQQLKAWAVRQIMVGSERQGTCTVHPNTPIISMAMHRYSEKTSHHGFRTRNWVFCSEMMFRNSFTGIILESEKLEPIEQDPCSRSKALIWELLSLISFTQLGKQLNWTKHTPIYPINLENMYHLKGPIFHIYPFPLIIWCYVDKTAPIHHYMTISFHLLIH